MARRDEGSTGVTQRAQNRSPVWIDTDGFLRDADGDRIAGDGGQRAKTLDIRGDSFGLGFLLTDTTKAFGNQFAAQFGLRAANYAVSATGVLRQYGDMVSSVGRTQASDALTIWLAGYNDMRSGATAARLGAWRGVFASALLLCASNWAGLRQYYNGGAGGTYYGAPASSFALSGSWGVSGYGTAGRWKGVNCSTNGATITAKVNGSVVYVCYSRQVVNTGGTFSVAIDGTTVLSSVAMSGTGLGVETDNDKPTADGNAYGYPTLLAIPVLPGQHSVVVTVTSSTNSANLVQIEFIAGNDDCVGQPVIVGGCPRMNAAGYAGSNAAYASQAVGDAAVAQYQRIAAEECAKLLAAGFDITYVDTAAYYDPTVSGAVKSDNIHPEEVGHTALAAAFSAGYRRRSNRVARAPLSGMFDITVPSSGTAITNNTPFALRYFVTGGTVSKIEWSPDGGTTVLQTHAATNGTLLVMPGESIIVTYSGAPTIRAAAAG